MYNTLSDYDLAFVNLTRLAKTPNIRTFNIACLVSLSLEDVDKARNVIDSSGIFE
jgi:hypothetical protein